MNQVTIFFVVLVISWHRGHAQDSAGYYNAGAPYFNIGEDSLAIEGYDAVAYHNQNAAVKGKAEFFSTYKGVYYRFSTAENKEAFERNPEQFLPAYGGWCAFGLVMDPKEFGGWQPGKYKVDPQIFKVIGNQLYLFYNENGFNALMYWNRNESKNKEEADRLWRVLHPEVEKEE